MATTFHLRLNDAEIDPSFPEVDRALLLATSTSTQTSTTDSQTGPLGAPIVATVGLVDARQLRWWSRQLQAVTISNNIAFSFGARENNAAANAMIGCAVYRTDYLGNIISLISKSFSGVELTTSLVTLVAWSATPTTTTLADGDRLLVLVEYTDEPITGEMASGFQLQIRYNNTAFADSTLTFTDTLTELASPVGTTHTLPQQGVGQ